MPFKTLIRNLKYEYDSNLPVNDYTNPFVISVSPHSLQLIVESGYSLRARCQPRLLTWIKFIFVRKTKSFIVYLGLCATRRRDPMNRRERV